MNIMNAQQMLICLENKFQLNGIQMNIMVELVILYLLLMTVLIIVNHVFQKDYQ